MALHLVKMQNQVLENVSNINNVLGLLQVSIQLQKETAVFDLSNIVMTKSVSEICFKRNERM